jgi:AcrR family transcriptional regulator
MLNACLKYTFEFRILMAFKDKRSGDTRGRLLDAACAVFAEKGFHRATVAEICKRARANIAAVNYHFGSKEALYKEAWRHAHGRMLKKYPPDGGVRPDAPPEQRLRGRIRSVLQRALSKDGLEFRILDHEIASPTTLLGEVFRDTIRPLAQALEQIVGELLGDQADEPMIRFCVTCIVGPCMQVVRRQRIQNREGLGPGFGMDIIENLAEHFTKFSLAGIREIRRRIESGTLGKQTSLGTIWDQQLMTPPGTD